MKWILFSLSLSLASACATTPVAKPAAYETELLACTAGASTMSESITCENGVRARYGRPPRQDPSKDGGQ